MEMSFVYFHYVFPQDTYIEYKIALLYEYKVVLFHEGSNFLNS